MEGNMLKGLRVGQIINYTRKKWRTLPDRRNHDNNNLTYAIEDVVIFPQNYRHKEETDWLLK